MSKVVYTTTDLVPTVIKGRLLTTENGDLKLQLYNISEEYWCTVVTLGNDKVIYVSPDRILEKFGLRSQDRDLK